MASCNEDGCSVLTSGKCVNGLDLDICPHYAVTDDFGLTNDQEDEDSDNNSDDVLKTKNSNNVVDTHSGKALSLLEADRISRSALTRIVILAGMPEAGKTTLLMSLMHLFATNSSYCDYIFAGSKTLLDFEEKSHGSKIDSEADKASTIRTTLGPPTFLHLKVAKENTENSEVDMLFTDISGEAFRMLKDSAEECRKFTLGLRADHFTLFFDTEMITSTAERAKSKVAGLGILKSLIDTETLLPSTHIQIVFSRWDLFTSEGNKDNHEKYIDQLRQDILGKYGDKFQIEFFEVSCRPDNDEIAFGYGLNNIFPLWAGKSALPVNTNISEQNFDQETERQFMKFNFNK